MISLEDKINFLMDISNQYVKRLTTAYISENWHLLNEEIHIRMSSLIEDENTKASGSISIVQESPYQYEIPNGFSVSGYDSNGKYYSITGKTIEEAVDKAVIFVKNSNG